MKLESIKVQNFKCFEKLSINFNPQMNVLIGNNGVGKTTILEAAAVGIGSFFLGIDSISSTGIKKEYARIKVIKSGSTMDRQPQYPVSITCEGNVDGQKIEWGRQLNSESAGTTYGASNSLKKVAADLLNKVRQGADSAILPVIAYYGTDRLWTQTLDSSDKALDNRLQGYTDCIPAKSNEKLMLKWFEKMTYIQLQEGSVIPELQAVNNVIAESYIESGAKVKDVKVVFNVKTSRLEVSYFDENGKYHNHPFSELSDGYRNTLSLISDIAYRMAVLNPQLLADVTKKTPGIVLIDEIDMHLHPIWQKNILRTLQNVFPLVQFIVTTHSPSVISSAKVEELLILDGQDCKSFDYEVYGKDVNSILTEIMGTSERPDEITDKFNAFEKLMDEGDYKGAENVLKELRGILGDNDNGVVSATVALDFQKDWED